jgi:hypothetical protein
MRKTNKSSGGTSFHGQIFEASVSELECILGPQDWTRNNGINKINYEWTMETDSGLVFTVYDWKYYRRLDPEETIIWNIGGHSQSTCWEAQEELEKAIKALRTIEWVRVK